jgi:1,2-diacylglycerol 3-beta-galactosyltransferase
MTLALFRNVKKIIQKVQPNAILSTNEMFAGPTGAVIQTMEDRPPFYTVVTDLADVHASWFNNQSDKFFVASDIARAKAIDCCIDPQKIVISGIPVNPGFAFPIAEKPEMRRKNGLDPHLPTLLFVGSQRVSGILDHLAALESLDNPFQVVVIAGGNQELFYQTIRHKWSFPIQIHNYVTDMPNWMLCADLLVTKAGGLIISEGLAAGLPIFLIDYLPGQEEGNVRFLVDHQAGAVATSPEVLARLVGTWLGQDPDISQTIAANARRCGHPDAALVIADSLWQADEVQLPPASQRPPFWVPLDLKVKHPKIFREGKEA